MCRVVIFDCSITPNIPNCLNFNNFFSIFHKISFYLNIPLCLDFIKALAVIAGAIVIGGKLALDHAIKPGSELISQEVSMTHFLGGDKKSAQNYIKDLRAEAKRTAFSSSEVISAGSRAIGITNGDTKQAMDLVKLSEDMSSLKPGKSISDAMEALADALHKKISHIGRLLNKSLKKTGTLRSRSEVKFSFKKLNSRNA